MATKSFNQTLIANGASNGTITVTDSSGFEVGATVFLAAKNERIQQLKVSSKPSATSVLVVTMADAEFDASAFTVAKQAKLFQPRDALLVPSSPPAQPFYSGSVTQTTTIAVPNGGTELVLNADTGNALIIKKNNVQKATIDADGKFTGAIDAATLNSSSAISSDITYYISPSGSDSNDGLSAGAPLQTIKAALSRIPRMVSSDITINLAPGTYSEYITDYRNFLSDSVTGKSSILFNGAFQDYTPTQGIASGTFDASFGSQVTPNIATVANGGWTTNELAGKFVQILSGALVGVCMPIMDNTETTLSFPFGVTAFSRNLEGLQFKIVEHAVTFQHPGGTKLYMLSLGGSSDVTSTSLTSTPKPAINCYGFYGIKFTASTPRNLLYINGPFRAESCSFVHESNSSGTRVSAFVRRTEAIFANCYFKASSASPNSVIHVSANNSSQVIASNTGLDGGINGFSCNTRSALSVSHTICQNQRLQGWRVFDATISGLVCVIIKNCPTGVLLAGTSSFAIFGQTSGGSSHIINCTTGISSTGNINGSSGTSNEIGSLTIDGCGTGISIQSDFTPLSLLGTLTIKNSTSWGVDVGSTKAISSSGFGFRTANLTMTNNASGDFTFDGTTPISLTEVNSAPNKIANDPKGRGNYIRGE